MRRWLAALGAVVLVLTGLAVAGNHFEMDERRIRLTGPQGQLDAVLTLPRQRSGPVPVVVFVHGDGPVEATNDGLYRPQFEALAKAGVASVSWSKPGVGGSEGDWLTQDQAERAREVTQVVGQLRQRSELNPDEVGLWGASQGGWVVPQVAADDPRISFVVLLSPAINWLRQGEFNLRATAADLDAALKERERINAVLERNGDYDDYLAADPDGEPMSRARWGFVLKNFRSDATCALHDLAARGTPVLLVLAGHDQNVDAHETERIYRSVLGPQKLQVRWFAGAAHSLARTDVEQSQVRGLLTAVFRPRRLMAPGFLDALAEYAATRTADRKSHETENGQTPASSAPQDAACARDPLTTGNR
ncbi:alpha/beta fold hydrolase [Kineosporia rhizophila]|uniref:alpha/beta hydrolase family protein n=1 Tax=Kineosporia rhizophila TaxID=84633 RepID=UPI001E327828|nr:alpha/beta fold hydrolase [Kineosporia rhizophila]MCE0535210.1 alpha/beta fold hydrolase [Kineosporia rhizophila]